MPKIITLSADIIAKTAAGEVVERAASVVKELIENSIDAGASDIQVEAEASGYNKISVTDNGTGMDKEDVFACFKPHTTSKISTENDLTCIKTLGFRGEALNSIASVSKLIIKSRHANSPVGALAEVEGGKVIKTGTVGMPTGTYIEVRDLFYNVPARKKFIKTALTEYRSLLDNTINYALAHPDIGLSLKHNRKIIFDLPKNRGISERLQVFLDANITDKLFPIKTEDSYFKLTGYISKPQAATESSRNQYLFVNGRPVKNLLVASVIKNAFGTLLEPRAHPPFVLFLNMPFEVVDVNIHPRKNEVAFFNEHELSQFIDQAVKAALKHEDLTYTTDFLDGYTDKSSDTYMFRVLKDGVNIWEAAPKEQNEEFGEVLQIHNLYLVTQTKRGLLLIDQHAAHERILYEQFMEAFKEKNKESAFLDPPSIINLNLTEIGVLNQYIEILTELGFDIERFGDNAYKVSCVPYLLKEQNVEMIVKEMLSELAEGKSPRDINKKSLQTLSFLACRSAIKAGDFLTPEERLNLVKKLMETKTEYTCPHGRPAKIEVPLRDLARVFKRIR